MYHTPLACPQLANSTSPLPNQLLKEVSDPEVPHLHMPLLAQGVDDAALDGAAAGAADGDAHLVVARQAVQLPLQLPRLGCQLLPATQTHPRVRTLRETLQCPAGSFGRLNLKVN